MLQWAAKGFHPVLQWRAQNQTVKKIEIDLPPAFFVDRYTWPYPNKVVNDNDVLHAIGDAFTIDVAPASVDLERPLYRREPEKVTQRISVYPQKGTTSTIVAFLFICCEEILMCIYRLCRFMRDTHSRHTRGTRISRATPPIVYQPSRTSMQLTWRRACFV